MEYEHYTSIGSSIIKYKISENAIEVVFNSGRYRHYLYEYSKAGVDKVEKMKALAMSGSGLNSYINQYAKFSYSKRW